MSLQPFWNYAVIIGNLLVIVGCVFNMKLADKVRRHHYLLHQEHAPGCFNAILYLHGIFIQSMYCRLHRSDLICIPSVLLYRMYSLLTRRTGQLSFWDWECSFSGAGCYTFSTTSTSSM